MSNLPTRSLDQKTPLSIARLAVFSSCLAKFLNFNKLWGIGRRVAGHKNSNLVF